MDCNLMVRISTNSSIGKATYRIRRPMSMDGSGSSHSVSPRYWKQPNSSRKVEHSPDIAIDEGNQKLE
ncbi:13270_t:CDS:1, partial [Acaulospora colombiana]